MKIRIQHRTTYSYKQPVTFGEHRIMIRPREGHDVHIESSVLEIHPAHSIRWMRDVNGNSLAKIVFSERAAELVFYSELVLTQYDTNPLDFLMEESAVNYPFVYEPESLPELTPFMAILYPRATASLREWLMQFYKPGDKIRTIDLLQRINLHICKNFRYSRRDAAGVQTPEETLRLNSGSCRDFAALLLEACRCWGLASRFVSGYMLCEATAAGGASTHAWAEVYLPGAGWKGFDPTSGLMTGAQHVPVAVSRNPENAAPVAGSFEGRINDCLGLQVEVRVTQIDKPTPSASEPIAHVVRGVTPPAQQTSQPQRGPEPLVVQAQQMAQQFPAPVMEMVIHAAASPVAGAAFNPQPV